MYYSSIEPFDRETLRDYYNRKIVICEPYYSGGILHDVVEALNGKELMISQFGMPHEFCSHYGSTVENMQGWKLTAQELKKIVCGE